MADTDLIWMSLVIFLPTVFALGLLFFPRGYEEAMRWWSLFGTAVTLGVSLCLFIQFRYDTLEGHIERGYEWFLLTKDHATGGIHCSETPPEIATVRTRQSNP